MQGMPEGKSVASASRTVTTTDFDRHPHMESLNPMKPIIILPPNVMSDDNIKLLRDNDLCVVVAENPDKVRFLDPIPVSSSRTQIEHAAIQLSRRLLNGQADNATINANRGYFAAMYFDLLQKGSPLQELFESEGHYAGFVAWRDWWHREIADPADQKELGQETLLGNLDIFTEIALYSAFTDFLVKHERRGA